MPPEWEYFTDDEKALMMALADPDAPVPMTFREFVQRVKPGYVWYEYADRLANVLQLVADGYYKRVMVFAPPRLGKSELVSRLFSAYYLYRFPDRWVALTSYAAELAYTLSRAARANYIEVTGNEKTGGDTEAVKHWETGEGGGLWAAGVRGPATGKGAHLFIIDDPIKDAQEAASETIQERNLEWNDSVVDTRLEKNAARIIIQTRWNQKDLAGTLLERERGDAPEDWHIVCFEAVKEPDDPEQWPSNCTIEPDWRAVGETVCPERLPSSRLDKLKKRNAYVWNAMFQQRPTPKEGTMFKRWWFEIVPMAPLASEIIGVVRAWDIGGTEDDGDYTVGLKMVKTRSGNYYITDVVRGQWASGKRDKIIRQVALIDKQQGIISGRPCVQLLPQDPAQAGKQQAGWFRKLLDGCVVHTRLQSGDKETRADPFASAAYAPEGEVGRVKLVAGAWNEPYITEVTAFPHGLTDDQVDPSSDAYADLTLVAPPRTDTNPDNYGIIRR